MESLQEFLNPQLSRSRRKDESLAGTEKEQGVLRSEVSSEIMIARPLNAELRMKGECRHDVLD